ncbi:MAG TPA: hypothetical protein VGI24_05540 [Solirubrobacteraceae bacterium]|jgi:hypothetical protein
MKRTITTFAALALAALALSAAASSASAALPEFTKSGVCEQTGELLWLYTESACATDSVGETGEFALSPILTSSPSATLETVGGLQIACTKKSLGQGETTGVKTVSRLVLKFKECSSGANSCGTGGTVTSNRLQGTLGYINATNKEVGLDLTSEAGGGALLEFTCEGTVGKVQVKGSVIGAITPVNTSTGGYTLTFALTKTGKQNITKFEGGAEDVLELSKEGGAFEKTALEATDTVIPLVEGEIKA